ncbi:MAG: hypothetical protein GVY14_12690 [Spirochaetes bacterium]|nr:hypothetical protein [Spirochaetota bacterium]
MSRVRTNPHPTGRRRRADPVLAVISGLLLLFGAPGETAAMGSRLRSEEVYTSRKLSEGYQHDESLYILVSYGLYRAPRGIARFPDGGRARYLFHETYLYLYDSREDRLERLLELGTGRPPGLDVRASFFEQQDDVLYVVFRVGHGSRDEPEAWRAAAWDMRSREGIEVETATSRALLERFHYGGEHRVSISEVTAAVGDFPVREWGLPSPLDYIEKRAAEYADDLVHLRGDQPYRDAIIAEIATGGIKADPAEILGRMEERRRSLEVPYRETYELFARDTMDGLERIR